MAYLQDTFLFQTVHDNGRNYWQERDEVIFGVKDKHMLCTHSWHRHDDTREHHLCNSHHSSFLYGL